MSSLPRLIFMGTPDFAVPTLKQLASAGADIALVVTQPDRPSGRGKKITPSPVKKLALEFGIPVFQPQRMKSREVLEHLSSFQAACAVVVAYGRILPQALLDLFPLGVLNVHASLLPRHRGAAPIQRALLEGDEETGVCIMLLDAGMDTGPVLSCASTPVGPHDNAGTVHDKLSLLGGELLLSTLGRWASGSIEPKAQDDSRATLAPPITKEELAVDWSAPAASIVNRIRAFDPFPGAYGVILQKRVKLFDAVLLSWSGEGLPGEVVGAGAEGLVVLGGDGRALAVGDLQLEGQRRLKAEEFLRGRPLAAGTRFE